MVINPCPIPRLTVSPTYQASPKVPSFQFLVGRLALDSLSKSIPETNPKPNYTGAFKKSKTGNPNEFLGQRIDFTPDKIHKIAKKFKQYGATIIGGCCETRPSHIEAMAIIK